MPNPPVSTDAPLSPAAFLTRLVAGALLVNLFTVILAGLSLQQNHHLHQERAEITTPITLHWRWKAKLAASS